MTEEILSFFSKVSKSYDISKDIEDLYFILVNEFHWTQEDIFGTDIPFIIQVLSARKRFIERSKKRK